MKERLITYYNTLKKLLRDYPLRSVLLLVVFVDMVRFGADLYHYADAPQVRQYRQVAAIIDHAEANRSVQTVASLSSIVSALERAKDVSLFEGKEGKRSVLVRHDKDAVLLRDVPSESLVRTLEPMLLQKGVEYRWLSVPKTPVPSLLEMLFKPGVSGIILVGALLYLWSQQYGSLLFGKKFTAKEPEEIEGEMDDLIGYTQIKAEAAQLLETITQKERYARYGIEGTFNILLLGRAGTGKSRFAAYLAKGLGMPIVSSTGSLDEVYVGSGAKKVRELFKQAEEMAAKNPHNACVLFIDEAQSLLRRRGDRDEQGWADDTRNELLAHLDGVERSQKHHIIVIMASNFSEGDLEMDEAMLRRFKKKIRFPDPDMGEREAILKHYLQKVEAKASHIDTPRIAAQMAGLTPGMIRSVVEEAGLEALREQGSIDTQRLMAAWERMYIGRSSRVSRERTEAQRRRVATHELGHFLVSYDQALQACGGDPVRAKAYTPIVKVSCERLDAQGALGYTLYENEEMPLPSTESLEWRIRGLYGGIAAEELRYGKSGVSMGGSDDIDKATALLVGMVRRNNLYGTAKINYEKIEGEGSRQEEIEQHAKRLYEETMEILRRYDGLLEYLTRQLMSRWSMDKELLFAQIEHYASESVLAI